ncbi:sensor histidine kinase [Roseovarius arcticus]|uniref:sensor histidine kinase n=1 Tax=Roseovarius arcticus TaxID=2547404 RepID=UPI001FE9A261|nr:HWE histidine kinase domain-containing protein [Roseovarius arcticus]
MIVRLAQPARDSDLLPNIASSVAVLAPRGRDASVAGQLLEVDNIAPILVASLGDLAELVVNQIGAVLITEEALSGLGTEALKSALETQPTWSDVPFIVLANGAVKGRSDRAAQQIDALGNVVLLSRPLHAEELVRAVRSALKARGRQHEARKQLEELQLRELQLYESEVKFRAISDSVDQMIWCTLPDGYHDYYNQRWYEFTGVPQGSTDGEAWNGMFHPDDQEKAWALWRHSLLTGDVYEVEYRLRHRSGSYRWVLGRAQPMRDPDGTILRWYGSCTDIHQIKMAEEQRQLMLGEMNHRVKNTLAMVNVMVSQTLRQADNLSDAQASIQSRISMMAQAHDRLIRAAWTETRICEVVEAALAPHRTGEGRFSIEGPDLPIGSKQALALTMALHELSTNASKYGALSVEDGKVRVAWCAEAGGDERIFQFTWSESNGPPVEMPTRRGFGSRMIEQALAGYFNGTAELIYDCKGLKFKLNAPLSGLTL